MMSEKTKLGPGGRIVIPADYRKALGLKPGDDLILILDEGELRLMTLRRAIERAQAIVRRYVPEGRLLSEELLEERREEAARG
ncbi:MAG: AbrB/MazE/SpoVT family DNA-binding domain-containing protein [Chloroflexi bacterium]|nr:AbrB/MazE/SpoVT family DNA-binding domain-containing protein [Chloroflexota bacterium]